MPSGSDSETNFYLFSSPFGQLPPNETRENKRIHPANVAESGIEVMASMPRLVAVC